MPYVVKSSLDIGGKIVPWNERETRKLIKEKEEFLKDNGINLEVKQEEIEEKIELIEETQELKEEIKEVQEEVEEKVENKRSNTKKK